MATKRVLTTLLTTSPLPSVLTSTQATNNTTMALPINPGKWKPPPVFDAMFLSVKIGSSLEAVLILSSNVALFLLLLTSPSLRRQMRYHLVLSLVCSNLIVGLFSSPFLVDFVVRRDWVHGCYFNVVRTLLTVYVQNFVSMWGMVLLLLHYLARLLKYEGPVWLVRLPSWLLKALPGLIVASPWIVAVVLQIPLVFAGLHPHAWVIWSEARCPLIMRRWATYLLTFPCFFIPAVVLLILIVLILVRLRDSGSSSTTSGEQLRRAEMGASLVSSGKEEVESGVVHVVGAGLSVLMMGPEHVFYGLRVHLYASQQGAMIGGVVALLLSELLPFVLAVVWVLMYPEVRGWLLELASRIPYGPASCCRRSPPPHPAVGETTVAPVSFRDLRDE